MAAINFIIPCLQCAKIKSTKYWKLRITRFIENYIYFIANKQTDFAQFRMRHIYKSNFNKNFLASKSGHSNLVCVLQEALFTRYKPLDIFVAELIDDSQKKSAFVAI